MNPRFSDEQKRQLRQQGVTTEQINELERLLLRIRLSAQSVPMAEVRGRLQGIADAAHALAVSIKRLDHAADSADKSAAWLLYETHSDQLAADHLADPLQAHYPDNPDPQALRVEVQRLETIAQNALNRLGDKQARPRTGSPWPVSWIDDALLEGWARTHPGHVYDSSDEEWLERIRNGALTEKPVPDYPFAPRKGGAFREIVCICYQAAGHPTADPEWAIKQYLRSERERWAWMNENLIDEGDASP